MEGTLKITKQELEYHLNETHTDEKMHEAFTDPIAIRPIQDQIISRLWHQASGVHIPKEKDSSEICKFGPICLLNVEGKIFVCVVAQTSKQEQVNRYLRQYKSRHIRLFQESGAHQHDLSQN